MVEVNELLRVSAEDFFDQVAQSIAYDITESTGKNVRVSQLHKGYSYTKKLKNKVGRSGEVKVTITDFEVPLIYKAKFETANGTNTISYEIERLEDGMIGVSYAEDYFTDSKLNSLNSKMTTALYKGRAKKKARRLLRAIERYILEDKEDDSEE